jgi:hypothetical protein
MGMAELEDQEMNFESHSQAGQDRFVWELLGPGPGTFLDIGANHPVEISNTYALEQQGWEGWLIENDVNCLKLLREQRSRRSFVMDADAAKANWSLTPCSGFDYLSLDVDEASLTVLQNLMKSYLRFDVLTVEHDRYRFGNERAEEMAHILEENGYEVLCADVCDQGLPFELWAVDLASSRVDPCKLPKFRRAFPTDWKEFFA